MPFIFSYTISCMLLLAVGLGLIKLAEKDERKKKIARKDVLDVFTNYSQIFEAGCQQGSHDSDVDISQCPYQNDTIEEYLWGRGYVHAKTLGTIRNLRKEIDRLRQKESGHE